MLVARDLMEGEIGAEFSEVAPETRLTHRDGYRQRGWATRVGKIELLIAQDAFGPGVLPELP